VTRPFYKREELRFECQGCGHCCTTWYGDVFLHEEDISRISERLEMDRESFEKRYVTRDSRGKLIVKLLPNAYCPFYTDGCTIHEFKPLTCMSWPFWDNVIDTERSWKKAEQRCPGMGKGRFYTAEEIERLRWFSPP
jgi:Fe-S-cluster containining protein